MNCAKEKYLVVDKDYLTFVFVAQKLCQYFLTHEVYLRVYDNLIQHLFQQPAMSRDATCWSVKLMEFDIKCFTQKAIKGQALEKVLANHPTLPGKKNVDSGINVADTTDY